MSIVLRTPYQITLLEVGSPPASEPGVVKLYALDSGGGNVELFIRDADGNDSQVTDGGTITAGALLDATGAVEVSSAPAPSVGQVLTATSSTSATWQTPSGGGAPSGSAGGDLSGTYPNPTVTQARGLKSSTTTVSVESATAPTTGQVLTATSSTAANWQTPSGGGGGSPVSEFETAPASPHANDREFTSMPSGWSLYRVGTFSGNADGVLVSPTAGNPNFTAGLTTGQTRLIANPDQKRSWIVWDSFTENRAWFYGTPITFGSNHVFRARLGMINRRSGSTPGDQGGLLKLVVVTSSGGVPQFSNVAVGMGWESESGTIKIKSGYQLGGSGVTTESSSDLSDLSIPDCEFVIRLASDTAYFFSRTQTQTLDYGNLPGMSGAGFSPGATIWVGFLWNGMNTIPSGGKMYSADYYRQQDDAVFYG